MTFLAMHFPISGTEISPIYLVVIGFLIGIMGGFFGVGGSFIAGPALRAIGMHWNFAVGTDLAHIVGKSVVAAKRHRALGNVDLRLGLIMALGTVGGAECGAQLIELLKRRGNVDLVVSIVSICIYCSISAFMIWETWKTVRQQKLRGTDTAAERASGEGRNFLRKRDQGGASHSALADGFAPHLRGKIDLALGHHHRLLYWRTLQRFPRRRRGLHSDADDGLPAGRSDASRGRDRSV